MRLLARELDFGAIRREFDLPEAFPAEARVQAESVTDRCAEQRVDATDIEFVTIDPPGARDLDQAVRIDARGDGHRVRYAIADVGALVEPGSALEEESLRRGQTIYLPDGSVPVHPPSLSEGSASLLPGQDRPAVLWTVDVDADGETEAVTVERATVRSRVRLDYAGVQDAADVGTLPPSIVELPTLGTRLAARGTRTGALTLRLPAQEVVASGEGTWTLRVEPRVAADDWNAQISLLVGRAAAAIMVQGRSGLLRTLPPAGRDTWASLRRRAEALGLRWPDDQEFGEFLDRVDPNTPTGLAMMRTATAALRGASYTLLSADGSQEVGHAGVGGPYAHVTAPIRRVGDRYATEACLALTAGKPVPGWVIDRLPGLPRCLSDSDRLASRVDRACVDLAEAVALRPLVGERVDVIVTRSGDAGREGEVWCADPPTFAPCTGPVREGDALRARVVRADISTREVVFAVDPEDVPSGGQVPPDPSGRPRRL